MADKFVVATAWNTRALSQGGSDTGCDGVSPMALAVERQQAVNRIATLLMDTWKRVDPSSGVAKNMASYVATFADMARAVVDTPSLTDADRFRRGVADEAVAAGDDEGVRGLLLGQAEFLCDRLDELDWCEDLEAVANSYSAHVDPALSRLKSTVRLLSPQVPS